MTAQSVAHVSAHKPATAALLALAEMNGRYTACVVRLMAQKMMSAINNTLGFSVLHVANPKQRACVIR